MGNGRRFSAKIDPNHQAAASGIPRRLQRRKKASRRDVAKMQNRMAGLIKSASMMNAPGADTIFDAAKNMQAEAAVPDED